MLAAFRHFFRGPMMMQTTEDPIGALEQDATRAARRLDELKTRMRDLRHRERSGEVTEEEGVELRGIPDRVLAAQKVKSSASLRLNQARHHQRATEQREQLRAAVLRIAAIMPHLQLTLTRLKLIEAEGLDRGIDLAGEFGIPRGYAEALLHATIGLAPLTEWDYTDTQGGANALPTLRRQVEPEAPRSPRMITDLFGRWYPADTLVDASSK